MGELFQHQPVHSTTQQGGLELFLVALHIAAVDDGGDDGRIGGGTADAVFLQRLDEGSFGIAGGRLGELLLALQLPQLEHLSLLQRGEVGFLLFLFVGGFLVQGGKAVKGHGVAAGFEVVIRRADGDRHGILLAVCHLACHKAAPDHAVQLCGVAADALVHLVRGQGGHRGTDGFVGVLCCRGTLGLPCALIGADIRLAVSTGDILLGGSHSLVRNAQTVGTHIGDKTHHAVSGNVHAFVQGLGGAHGAGGCKAQPAGGLLLQGTGDKGRGGLLCALAALELAHHIACALQTLFNGTCLGLAFGQQLFAVGVRGKACHKAFVPGTQGGVHVPVFIGLKVFDLLFPVIDQPHRHALHTACGQAAAHLTPQERTELVAHQTVQHAARLLGVEQIFVDGTGVGHALLHTLFGDLVKGDTVGLVGVQPQNIGQMPADGLALAVRVGRQQHAVGVFGLALQLLDELFLALDADVLRGIAMLHINAQLRCGQIADMAHAGSDLVVIAQIFADGFRLCRRLHDNQFRHFFFSPLSATCPQRDARSFAHIIVPQLLCALPAEIFHNFTAAHTAAPAACTPGR